MRTFFQYVERFTPMLLCALPVHAVADAVVAEQQGVANTFARLGIIPKPIRVSEDVYNGPVPGL